MEKVELLFACKKCKSALDAWKYKDMPVIYIVPCSECLKDARDDCEIAGHALPELSKGKTKEKSDE